MSTAQKIFVKAQTLPEQTKDALLKPAEKLAANGHSSTPQPKSQFGSARGLIQIGPDFDEPLEDFKSYME